MIILEPSSCHDKRWRDLVHLTLRCYVLDGHVLSDVADLFIFWARLDNIIVTWILDTLFPRTPRDLLETDGDCTSGVAHNGGSILQQQ
jgi:hypothetical protein